MKKKAFYILTISFVFLFLLIGCNKNKSNPDHKNETTDKRIDSINVLYFNHQPSSDKKIAPSDIQLSIPDFESSMTIGVLDASITDTTQINTIQKLMDALTPSIENKDQNARIVVNIKHKDGSESQLTLNGEYANEIFLNGIKQEDNNELVFYLKNYIGYYPWFIGDALAMMPELKDNSFSKEPFYRSKYYKDWQMAESRR